MKKLCVIGDPVGHSMSPLMHNAAIEHLGLQDKFVFGKRKIPRDALRDFVCNVRGGEFTGLSVTHPHKEAIIPLLDQLSVDAKLAGAVNTVTRTGTFLRGHNTDGAGCAMALENAGISMKGKSVVILGAGGSSRAIAVSLGRKGARICLLNRTLARARMVATKIHEAAANEIVAFGLDMVEDALYGANILINATPVGLRGLCNRSLVPPSLLKPEMTVFDLVYEPAETKLLKDARTAGADTISGTEMLLYQGALQFRLFTGKTAPVGVMRAALRRHPEA